MGRGEREGEEGGTYTNFDLLLALYIKMNLKWTIGLNVTPKIVKFYKNNRKIFVTLDQARTS